MTKNLTGTVRRVLLTAAAAAIVAAAIGGVSLARAGGTSPDRTLILTEVQTAARFISISHTQQGAPGDEFAFHSILKNRAGDRVGTLDAICVLVLHNRIQCQGTFRLPGGTISGTALAPANQNSTAPTHVAITGGTGSYDHVHGQVTTAPVSPTTSRDVIDIDA